MVSLRALWVLWRDPAGVADAGAQQDTAATHATRASTSHVLLSKRFPTAEKRARAALQAPCRVAQVPPDQFIAQGLERECAVRLGYRRGDVEGMSSSRSAGPERPLPEGAGLVFFLPVAAPLCSACGGGGGKALGLTMRCATCCPCERWLFPLVLLQRGPFQFLALPAVSDPARFRAQVRCGRSLSNRTDLSEEEMAVTPLPWEQCEAVVPEVVAAQEFLQDFLLLALAQFGYLKRLPPLDTAVSATSTAFSDQADRSDDFRATPPPSHLPEDGVSAGSSFVTSLRSRAGALPEENNLDALTLAALAVGGPPTGAQVSELRSMLARMAPFGCPYDTSIATVPATLVNGFGDFSLADTAGSVGGAMAPHLKQPSFKPFLYEHIKREQSLRFLVRETIEVVQYDKEKQFGVSDTWRANGQVLCSANLERLPEVRCRALFPRKEDVQPDDENTNGVIEHLSLHRCATEEDRRENETSRGVPMSFRPPLGEFELARYQVSECKFVPIRGFYQLRDAGPLCSKVLVQLKLHEFFLKQRGVNSFEYCNCEIRFPGRGFIERLELAATAGTVSLSHDRRAVLWSIGTKFTARHAEVALPATVYFRQPAFGAGEEASGVGPIARQTVHGHLGDTATASSQISSREQTEQFQSGGNSFVRLMYRLTGTNLTDSRVEPRSVEVELPPSEGAKWKTPQITQECDIVCSSHLIWNSHATRVEHI